MCRKLMNNEIKHTLPKEERLCSKKALDELFGGGHQSVASFPLRAVFMTTEEAGARILVSVSKRFFKRAVHRNRIKRQLRETYRLQKELLETPDTKGVNIAFLWTSNEILPTEIVMQKMRKVILRISESLSNSD